MRLSCGTRVLADVFAWGQSPKQKPARTAAPEAEIAMQFQPRGESPFGPRFILL